MAFKGTRRQVLRSALWTASAFGGMATLSRGASAISPVEHPRSVEDLYFSACAERTALHRELRAEWLLRVSQARDILASPATDQDLAALLGETCPQCGCPFADG